VSFELYDVSTEGLIDKFVDKAKNTDGLLAIMQKKIPDGFRKIPGVPPVGGETSGAKDDAEAYYKRGVEYFGERDYDKAISEFTQAIRLNPKYAEVYYYRGGVYEIKGEHDIAISDLTEAIRLNPKYAEAYYCRGLVYGGKGDYDKAISDYNQAIRLNPKYAEAYYNRGNAYSYKKDYDKAISDYNQAIRLNPKYAEAYYWRGNAYSYKKDYDKAISDYNQAIRLNLKYAEVYYNRGNAYSYKKDYDKAISDLTEAIRLNPKFAEAYIGRGLVYGGKGDHDKVISDLTQAIRLNPNDAEAYIGRGLTYSIKKDYDKAISDLTQAIRLNPNDAEAYIGRGLLYGGKGDYDKAIADYESALRIDPNHSNAKKYLELAKKSLKNKTAPPPATNGISGGMFTDSRDGKKYKTVKIGGKTWMAENLNYAAGGSKCYDNNPEFCQMYGRLYDWTTAMKVCPSGWHLPRKSEYQVLDNAIGGKEVAGKKLKAKSGWNSYQGKSGNGTDEYGFSALPGGSGTKYSDGDFNFFGSYGFWWSASENGSNHAYYRRIYYSYGSTNMDSNLKNKLYSVRCLQD